jgi:hypothetical protein
MMVGLLFFVLLISYFPNSYGGTRCEANSRTITTSSRSSPGRGEIPRPDEPSAWSVRFINLDRRLASDWDVAEGQEGQYSLIRQQAAKTRRSPEAVNCPQSGQWFR